MLGNGQSVDLLKLFMIVREKGGGDAVSKNGLWDTVTKESGLGLNHASSLKSVYFKHLGGLEKWLEKLVQDKYKKSKLSDSEFDVAGVLTALGAEFKGFLSEVLDSKQLEWISNMSVEMLSRGNKLVDDEEESMQMDATKDGIYCVEGADLSNDEKSPLMDSSSNEKGSEDVQENLQSDSTRSEKVCDEDETKSTVVEMNGGKMCANSDEDDAMELNSDNFEQLFSYHKRERESMSRMLNWVSEIAKNPCDPVVVPLPERSKWNSHENGELWKQVLLAREALFLKRQDDSNAEHPGWQKNSRMHPSMYEDHIGSSYNLRERLKCTKKVLHRKSPSKMQAVSRSSLLASQTDLDSCTGAICDGDSSTERSILDLPIEKPIPVGPHFQAEVTEWTGLVCESDSKWVGTRVWPQEKVDNKFLIEREPIGRGRQDSCGCQVRNSVECVRFHCQEKLLKLRLELGFTFYSWRLNRMGEQVKQFWTLDEEKKFNAIISSNRALDKCFWEEMVKSFPTKRREDLMSYYFNVFLLQRRAHQNRFSPDNIDSDDEELESVSLTNCSGKGAKRSPGSIFYSPKKQRKNAQ